MLLAVHLPKPHVRPQFRGRIDRNSMPKGIALACYNFTAEYERNPHFPAVLASMILNLNGYNTQCSQACLIDVFYPKSRRSDIDGVSTNN